MTTFDRDLLPKGNWKLWDLQWLKDSTDGNQISQLQNYFWKPKITIQQPAIFHHIDNFDADIVAFAILTASCHADLRALDEKRRSVLHRLILRSEIDHCLVRLAMKANPCCVDIVDVYGRGPYHAAAARGDGKLIDMLKQPVITAERASNLWQQPPRYDIPGVSINERDNEGWAPIHLALERLAETDGQNNVIDNLCSGGSVNINARRGFDGSTPAHQCVAIGDTVALDKCLRLGANLSIVNNNGLTPLDTSRNTPDHSRIIRVARPYACPLQIYRCERDGDEGYFSS